VPIPRSTRRWILEVEAKENPGDQQAHLHVALAYAAMGWQDAALAEIARAKDKPDGWQMAALLVHAGERDAPLRLLEQLPATDRLASTEIGSPAVAAPPSRGAASRCDTQSAVAPVTFFATGRKLSGRNGNSLTMKGN
jgi:hypothetical protein